MISITKKEDCCGCSACAQRCPKQCITMQTDNEGFLYPIADANICIECGLCEKVCPVINQNLPQKPIKAYAAYNKNEETRMQSSSGGIFTLLAEKIIDRNGVVFGVKFNEEWQAVFDYAETKEGIAPFRGSKYLQAIVGKAYKQAEEFLKNGREVLFSGTPCQIAGLKKFLRKEYENLLTVDIICHGVPSPKVWNMYLQETYSKLMWNRPGGKNTVGSAKGGKYKSCIETISFRSKITGWKKFSFLLKLNFSNYDGKNTGVFSETVEKNTYMRAFLSDTILRPSCYSCPAKQNKSNSDITIADFWGINLIDPYFDDDKGCGAIIINTQKGLTIYPIQETISKEYHLQDIIKYNPAYNVSCKPHPNRTKFFKKLGRQQLYKLIDNTLKPTLKAKIKRYIIAVLRRLHIKK